MTTTETEGRPIGIAVVDAKPGVPQTPDSRNAERKRGRAARLRMLRKKGALYQSMNAERGKPRATKLIEAPRRNVLHGKTRPAGRPRARTRP